MKTNPEQTQMLELTRTLNNHNQDKEIEEKIEITSEREETPGEKLQKVENNNNKNHKILEMKSLLSGLHNRNGQSWKGQMNSKRGQ